MYVDKCEWPLILSHGQAERERETQQLLILEDGDRAAAAVAALKVVKRGGAVADVGETNSGLHDCQVEVYFDCTGGKSQWWSKCQCPVVSKFIRFAQLMKDLRFNLFELRDIASRRTCYEAKV